MKFLPQRAPIDSFGNGGFRFAGMSHQGSILVLPSGMRAWGPSQCEALTADDFADVIAENSGIDVLLLGTGTAMVRPPKPVMECLAAATIQCDFMSTGSAVHVYNVVLAEGRRVAAALLAVENARESKNA